MFDFSDYDFSCTLAPPYSGHLSAMDNSIGPTCVSYMEVPRYRSKAKLFLAMSTMIFNYSKDYLIL